MNLKFGTGGLRATMGPGPDHMNLETIQEATLGVAAYAKEQSDNPSAALALRQPEPFGGVRPRGGRVLAMQGCKAYIYPKLMPTPTLSFAVRHLKTTVGIVVTASHNPREYNGYKVYGSDGCQVTNEAADRIQQHIWAADKSQARGGKTFEEYVEDGQIVLIDEKTLKAFLAGYHPQADEEEADLRPEGSLHAAVRRRPDSGHQYPEIHRYQRSADRHRAGKAQWRLPHLPLPESGVSGRPEDWPGVV